MTRRALRLESISKSKASEATNKKIKRVVDDNGKVSDTVSPIASGTTVDVYNNSRYNKKQAAAANWGAKIAGGAAGSAAGYGIYRALRGNVKVLRVAGKKMSADKKRGIASAALTSVGSSVGGYAGGRTHQEYVKKNPRYRYEDK